MKDYAVGVFPNVNWSIASNVTNLKDDNTIRVGAIFDEEKNVAHCTIAAYGFKVQIQASAEGAHEIHAVTFALDRAKAVITAFTGRELPTMMAAPRDVMAQPKTPDAESQGSADEPQGSETEAAVEESSNPSPEPESQEPNGEVPVL